MSQKTKDKIVNAAKPLVSSLPDEMYGIVEKGVRAFVDSQYKLST